MVLHERSMEENDLNTEHPERAKPGQKSVRYLRALRFRWLTRFYDPLLRFVLREGTFKRELLRRSRIAPGQTVLDLGCGTGTLTLMVKQAVPDAKVHGLDPDEDALAIAAEKAARMKADVRFQRGTATALPFADGSFDRVLSSLMFHHLPSADKRLALAEILRVLAPGGEVHLADWGPPPNLLMRLAFQPVRFLDGYALTEDNVMGRLPDLGREVGFEGFRQTACFSTLLGSIALFKAGKDSERLQPDS